MVNSVLVLSLYSLPAPKRNSETIFLLDETKVEVEMRGHFRRALRGYLVRLRFASRRSKNYIVKRVHESVPHYKTPEAFGNRGPYQAVELDRRQPHPRLTVMWSENLLKGSNN